MICENKNKEGIPASETENNENYMYNRRIGFTPMYRLLLSSRKKCRL